MVENNPEGHSSYSLISTSPVSNEPQFEIEDPPYLTQEELNSFLGDLSFPSPDSNTESISKSKIDNILELESFIRQKRAERWGGERIAKAWNGQHPEQTIASCTILKWLKKNGFPELKQNNEINENPELKSFIIQKRKRI